MKLLSILVLCGALGLSANIANANTQASTEAGLNQVVAYNTVYYGYSPYYYRHHHYNHPRHHNKRVFIYVKPAYHETVGHHHRHHGRHHGRHGHRGR